MVIVYFQEKELCVPHGWRCGLMERGAMAAGVAVLGNLAWATEWGRGCHSSFTTEGRRRGICSQRVSPLPPSLPPHLCIAVV